MKWFFVLGRNPELSRLEVLSYLEARNRSHTELFFEGNLLLIETNEGEEIDIQEFGGVLKLGVIEFEGTYKAFLAFLESRELVPSDKFTYATFGNYPLEEIKEKFKRERKKGILKHGRRQVMMQSGDKVNLATNADFSIFLHEVDNVIYYGLGTQEYDYSEVKRRDMEKPVRREHLAISPRLSKILVNLSGVRARDLLLDPFVGIGAIVFEAALKGVTVYGADINRAAIEGAEKNVSWLKEHYNVDSRITLKQVDSKKIPDMQWAGVATETPLGKVLKKKPKDFEAKKIIQDFEAFIIPILRRLQKTKKAKAKIAITFPKIRSFRVDILKVAEKCGLNVVHGPVEESRLDQFISRDILVFR